MADLDIREVRIERRLGELLILTSDRPLSSDQLARIRAHAEYGYRTGVLILDSSLRAELVTTPATMNADYWSRFGDS